MKLALAVDRNGILNAFLLPGGVGSVWQGPILAGFSDLVPGSRPAICPLSATAYSVLVIDREGVLNAFFVDTAAGGGWEGPAMIGQANLVPGSTLAILHLRSSLYAALAVDQMGVLNVFSLNSAGGQGWQGPVVSGNPCLIPGSLPAITKVSSSVYTALIVDAHGMLNAFSVDLAAGGAWTGPLMIGNANLVPGSLVAA